MNHEMTPSSPVETLASTEVDLERQAYLDELQIDSLQFGVGRGAEAVRSS